MGLIKTIVTPLAIIAMKMSFPSYNEKESTSDGGASVPEKETKYSEISDKKTKQDNWFDENPGLNPKNNPWVLTSDELKFWNEYNLEKQLESELNSEPTDVEDKVSKKFGDKFGTLYEIAIMNFLKSCIVKPIGGPASITKTASIKSDLQKCGEESYRETFLGAEDPEDSAVTFGKEFANGCFDIHEQQVILWSVIPAAPPITPVTPGGPIIAVPTMPIVPVMLKALKNALEKTYPPGSSDPYKIADKFATKLGAAGVVMGTYALTCKCPPGGGNIIIS